MQMLIHRGQQEQLGVNFDSRLGVTDLSFLTRGRTAG
jgi:hypothetical protein